MLKVSGAMTMTVFCVVTGSRGPFLRFSYALVLTFEMHHCSTLLQSVHAHREALRPPTSGATWPPHTPARGNVREPALCTEAGSSLFKGQLVDVLADACRTEVCVAQVIPVSPLSRESRHQSPSKLTPDKPSPAAPISIRRWCVSRSGLHGYGECGRLRSGHIMSAPIARVAQLCASIPKSKTCVGPRVLTTYEVTRHPPHPAARATWACQPGHAMSGRNDSCPRVRQVAR